MNDPVGITKDFQISESYPATKILWLPKMDDTFPADRDLFATSSDILRLYQIHKTNTDLYAMSSDPIELRNTSEYC